MRRELSVHLLLLLLVACGKLTGTGGRPADGDYDDDDDYDYDLSYLADVKQASGGSGGTGGGGGGFWSETRPCSCANSICGCCTGQIFPLPAFLRQRACMNFTYIEDEFALKMSVTLNDRLMYNNKVSGRNPRPVCVSPPRISLAKLCIKLHDVFLVERNIHACVNVEGLFNKNVIFGGTMGCMRLGADGFAVVRPEDGGGLPPPDSGEDEEPNEEYDYDQVDEEEEQNETAADNTEDNNVENADGEKRKAAESKIVGVGTVKEV